MDGLDVEDGLLLMTNKQTKKRNIFQEGTKEKVVADISRLGFIR